MKNRSAMRSRFNPSKPKVSKPKLRGTGANSRSFSTQFWLVVATVGIGFIIGITWYGRQVKSAPKKSPTEGKVFEERIQETDFFGESKPKWRKSPKIVPNGEKVAHDFGKVTILSGADTAQNFIGQHNKTILLFTRSEGHTGSCTTCEEINSSFETLAKMHEGVAFGKIYTDHDDAAVPTVIAYSKKKEYTRTTMVSDKRLKSLAKEMEILVQSSGDDYDDDDRPKKRASKKSKKSPKKGKLW